MDEPQSGFAPLPDHDDDLAAFDALAEPGGSAWDGLEDNAPDLGFAVPPLPAMPDLAVTADVQELDTTDSAFDIEPAPVVEHAVDVQPIADTPDIAFDIEPASAADSAFDLQPEPVADTAFDLQPVPVTHAPLTPEPAPALVQVAAAPVDDEPQDLLYAIAVVDPEAEQALQANQAVSQMRKSALADAELTKGRGRGRKSKQTLRPLPFDAVTPGQPLIAAIYSPSGGVGKSSTAMNLGAYCAAVAKAMVDSGKLPEGRAPRILVLDGDVVQGSLALRLTGEIRPSMHTLQLYKDSREDAGFTGENAWPKVYAREDAAPGEKAMQHFVMWNDQYPNLNLLAAPDSPDKFFDFGPAEYHQMLQFLGSFYDVIILDCGTELVMESQRAWLAHAHQVFMITAPMVDRLYNAQKAARYMVKRRPHPQDQREEPELLPPLATKEKLAVVLTKADADTGLDPEDALQLNFGRFIDQENWFRVPDVSREMDKANNTGQFLVLEHPAYAKVIGELTEHMFRRYTDGQRRSLPAAA